MRFEKCKIGIELEPYKISDPRIEKIKTYRISNIVECAETIQLKNVKGYFNPKDFRASRRFEKGDIVDNAFGNLYKIKDLIYDNFYEKYRYICEKIEEPFKGEIKLYASAEIKKNEGEIIWSIQKVGKLIRG